MTFEDMGIERRDFARMGSTVVAGGLGALMAGGFMAAGSASASEDADLADRLQQIEDQLWVLGAKEAIRTKLYLYCRGDDRQDPDTGKQAFAEDSHVDYGTHPVIGKVFEGPGRDWVEHCAGEIDPGITARGGYYMHYYCNTLIYVNGTKAGSETYSYCPQVSLKEDGTYTCTTPCSRHCDKWEYVDGEWSIVERETASDFAYSFDLTGCNAPYANAKMGPEDFSYEFLAYGQED